MLDYAWIIALIPAISFVLILFFGKRLPRQGSEIGILALGASFVLACVAVGQWIDRVESHGEGSGAAGAPLDHLVAERRGEVRRGDPDGRPRGDDAVRRHADLAARAHLLHRVHARRRPLHALLRDAQPVHGLDAAARHLRQHDPAARRLGRRRSLLVRPHRALVGGTGEQPSRAQGVPHHPHRRHRPDDRHHHHVLRRRELQHRRDQPLRA